MKKIVFLLFSFVATLSTNSQNFKEKVIQSEVNSAIVFLKNAQISREKSISLTKGENTLKFVNLSPFIDRKSIQIKADDIEIQAINFQKNYVNGSKKKPEIQKLETTLASRENKINSKNVDLEIVKEEISFLKSNKTIGGNQTLTATTFKEAANYYGNKIKVLKTAEYRLKKEILNLKLEVSTIKKQLDDVTLKRNFGTGEIILRLKSKVAKNTKFVLSYHVSNVGWYPSYDVRAKNINSPLSLIYKANLYQNSKVDWTNVNLSFSSGNPTKSNKVKAVIPYFIDYGTYPPNYTNKINRVSGNVSSYSEPLSGASIAIKGTTIGTTADFDGNFSLETPNDNSILVISYLGYKPKEIPVNNDFININLEEDSNRLDEIVVVGYGTKRKGSNKNERNIGSTLAGAVSGLRVNRFTSTKKEQKSILKTKQVVNQTTVNFKVIKPYSIASSNKNFIIPMRDFNIDATYQYYSFPRAEESAFLVAKIKGWEKYNLLEAEANIYFEDTFIGTSLINTRIANTTLEISLGIDKNVTISRNKEKDFTTKQFMGKKKEEFRIWNYSLKNNKNEAIDIVISDQIPLSKSEQITITLDRDATKGTLNDKTGEIKWTLNLKPKKLKEFELKYAVKYPKSYRINLD